MAFNCGAAAQSLIDEGYALLKDDASLMPMVRRHFRKGKSSFSNAMKRSVRHEPIRIGGLPSPRC